MKIGKAKYGITQKKYFKLKDGESTFRILPPLGDLADDGRWSVFYKVHYGYKNSKGKLRVFQSSLVKNRKTKMVEVPDAAAERIDTLKAKLQEAKDAGQKAVVEKLGPLVSGQKPMYNLDSNHYMNVVDEQGNIGVLKLRHRAKQVLDDEIKALREKGIDPLSVDNGRYFVFRRSGSGLETSFAVRVKKEKITVDGVGEVERDLVHKLNNELISRLGEEADQLDKLYKEVSSDDIARIVKASDLLTGISPVIDEIFDNQGDSGSSSSSDDEDYGDEDDSSDSKSSSAASSSNDEAAAAAAKAKADAEAKARIEAVQAEQAAAAKAKADAEAKAAATAAAAKTETKTETKSGSTQTTAEAVGDMSDDEFLKSLGL
jgi:hypothetical protein